MKSYLPSVCVVERDTNRCIQCKVCVNQCTFDVHYFDGSVSLRVRQSLPRAATELATPWDTGEDGLHPSLAKYAPSTIVQVAFWSC